MKRAQIEHRSLYDIIRWVGGIIPVCFILLFGCVFWFPIPEKERITVVVASTPIVIATIDTIDHKATLFSVPEDITIEGAYAMGRYPIASFWKMGALDRKDHALLATSIQQSFGIPIEGYVGREHGVLTAQTDAIRLLFDMFSYRSMVFYASKRYVTNLSLSTLIRLYRTIPVIRQSDVSVHVLGPQTSTFTEELPDGTSRTVLDPLNIDLRTKGLFERSTVRKEALSVGVVNTTGIPELAKSIARQLGNSGMFVVSLESEDKPLARCTVSAKKELLKSSSISFIHETYGCDIQTLQGGHREDILIKIGTDIGAEYQPRLRH